MPRVVVSWDEQYPVYSLDTDTSDYHGIGELLVDVPQEFIDRWEACEVERDECVGLLRRYIEASKEPTPPPPSTGPHTIETETVQPLTVRKGNAADRT